jgi:RNA polymerase sigma factor (TIGR02999 family)
MHRTTTQITQLLSRVSAGDKDAEDKVLGVLYKDLRRLAKHYLAAERRDHTLQATALVHEAYLRMNKQAQFEWQNRSHFFAIAATAMRRVLVDHARGVKAIKRDAIKLPLESSLFCAAERPIEVLAVHEALDKLVQLDPRQAQITELRYFGGFSEEEIAQILGISLRTVKRDWNSARAWLYDQLKDRSS